MGAADVERSTRGLFCLALAFTVVALLGMRNVISAEAAVAIAMTSTALGTLLPILKDNKLLDTRLGKTVLNHGAVGELGPVVAMAVLLSARGAVLSLIVLARLRLDRCHRCGCCPAS